jgi:hypothetical protein
MGAAAAVLSVVVLVLALLPAARHDREDDSGAEEADPVPSPGR